MSEFRYKNIRAIRLALDHHNATCPVPAAAILLNPTDHGLLGVIRLWDVEIRPDERVPVKRIRILCGGSSWLVEDELDAHLERPAKTPAPRPLF